MDASDRGNTDDTGDAEVDTTWFLKVGLLFALVLTVALGLGIGLGIIPV